MRSTLCRVAIVLRCNAPAMYQRVAPERALAPRSTLAEQNNQALSFRDGRDFAEPRVRADGLEQPRNVAFQAHADELEAQARGMQLAINALQAEVGGLTFANSGLAAQNAKLLGTESDLRAELAATQERERFLDRESSVLKGHVGGTDGDITGLVSTIASLRQRVDRLEASNRLFQENLNACESALYVTDVRFPILHRHCHRESCVLQYPNIATHKRAFGSCVGVVPAC
jgi:chromosome segregation ATPase